ncbi:MAG: VWA domain-containing protein [Faecousia sp.]
MSILPETKELGGIVRKNLHVFYILDTSKSMQGERISMLNAAMEETLKALGEAAKKNSDAKIKVAIMEFNTGARWITEDGPEDFDADDFAWTPLTAGGLTDMGAALTELNSKLSQRGWLKSMEGALMPILIFMTDGRPTDNYLKALEEIKKNRWFARATKIGFAVGDKEDTDMVKTIETVVGNIEAVITTSDLEQFRRLLKFVTLTSSMLASRSIGAEEVDGKRVVEDAKKLEEDGSAEETLPEETSAEEAESDPQTQDSLPEADPFNSKDFQ